MTKHHTSWDYITNFQSASHSQKFLRKCYLRNDFTDHKMLSYKNSDSFLAYLEHGKLYIDQAEQSSIFIKPVLLFYGLINLIKACILTVDPSYPSTTAILSHGLSSRKRKKRNYFFFQDEVKIQKHGLFSHFSSYMFHVKHLEGNRMMMGDLFKHIPELDESFTFIRGESSFIPVKNQGGELLIHFHDSSNKDEWLKHLSILDKKQIVHKETENGALALTIHGPMFESKILPVRYHLFRDEYCLPRAVSNNSHLPELIIYYALLYNLSMIARYETEWWGELIKLTPNQDYPLITKFLAAAEEKIPLLIGDYLNYISFLNIEEQHKTSGN
ncbi:YaaC family protein [Falsibacillus albus]|uniref:YaaC family protein n=1 Tax=Falsibacillus albus TaxID=2478915 RepID=A0A3L7JHN2_9BACI|nr:YaaC family protein [Falsibacillus albus]RLQ90010.1 hypothetical protein D9X91_21815 [Falsibacillus albus]